MNKGVVLFLMLLLTSCRIKTSYNFNELIQRTDKLFDAIADGTANDLFSEEYFPKNETVNLMHQLNDFCDFKNRKGGFINGYYSKSKDSKIETINLVYKYYLKCDSVSFTVAYIAKDNKLYSFHLGR